MKGFILAIISFLVYSIVHAQEAQQITPNKVVAHRGAWKNTSLPQNSIASLKKAIEIGCAGTEFDVHLTADNILVLCHDNDHMGMEIENTTYADLAKELLPNGETLPTLREALTEGAKQSSTKLFLEVKSSSSVERTVRTAEKAVKVVKEMNAHALVTFITFNYSAAQRIIEISPNSSVAYLNGDAPPQQLNEDNIPGLNYNLRVLKKYPEWIQEAKTLGIMVNVWTVNKPEDIDWFLEQEVDYITTDEPELLLKKFQGGF